MEPMLRQDRDLVVIRTPGARLRKYDVALYKTGRAYVLHRVMAVRADHYLIRGDNTFVLETVPDRAVLGVLTSFVRKGKTHGVDERGYRAYVRVWHALYPLRYLRHLLLRGAVRAARAVGLLPRLKALRDRLRRG